MFSGKEDKIIIKVLLQEKSYKANTICQEIFQLKLVSVVFEKDRSNGAIES